MNFVDDLGNVSLSRSPYPMQVLYKPPSPVLNASFSGLPTMHFTGKAANVESEFLFDSGASVNYISIAFARRCGLVVKPCDNQVVLGNNEISKSHGVARVFIKLGNYQGPIECLVLTELISGIDVILGDGFMEAHKVKLDYDTHTCTLRKGRKRITIRLTRPVSEKRGPRIANSLSAMQLKRLLRKGCKTYLVLLSEDKPEESFERTREDLEDDPCHVKKILKEYRDVFPEKLPPGLPPVRDVVHSIVTEPGHVPPFRPMYRLSPAEISELKEQIAQLLEKGFIEPSVSPYGAPILFAEKPGGGLRLCQDYRLLNSVTVKNRYPLPRIDDLLDKVTGSSYFSCLDLSQGYHQIRVAEEDVPKTAFRTPFGHYQFKVMTFGLCNAPATFQSVMDQIFRQHLGDFVVVYLDDILIFSKTVEEHEQHLRIVLEILRKEKFYAAPHKCHFAKPEIKYQVLVTHCRQRRCSSEPCKD